MPLEDWKYQNLKARIVDIMNIAFRFQAQDAINQGRGAGIFNVEGEN